jgi:ankyrin repeat protein
LRYQPDILRGTHDPTPWWSLATAAAPEDVRWAIQNGLDPNRRNWLGITLLHRCAAKGEIGIAEVCLESNADINAIETEYSSAPLGWAAREGRGEMVRWLLGKGANPNLPGDEPWARPAQWAKRRGHEEIVALIDH